MSVIERLALASETVTAAALKAEGVAAKMNALAKLKRRLANRPKLRGHYEILEDRVDGGIVYTAYATERATATRYPAKHISNRVFV